ncbi:MAG: T9SS type A sorting domain-containing protein, partial [Saprospiraceae bacterium]|nr:T9SS type A sorting domain-containing protein [Saprospiraceae bacterium]
LASGNELNGLSLGAVGSGTTLEYIEIYANSDDGIEFFGGAPNLKYAVVAFAEDDSYDWDEVYTGKGQFWFSIQRPDIADAAGELDGTTPDDLTPFSNPTIYNWTHIGSGIGATASNPIGWLFRAGTAGTVANSIVTAQKGKVLEVQDKNAGTNDSYEKLKNGSLKILNNVFYGNGSNAGINATSTGIIRVTSGQPTQDEATPTTLINHLTTNQTSLESAGIRSISRIQDGKLDPRPSANGSAYTTPLAALPANDPFFTMTSYKGAFSADEAQMWLEGWSTLDRNGHLNLDTPTSVDEELDKAVVDRFKMYPNPVTPGFMFTIESDFDEQVRIDIFSIDGRLIRTVPVRATGFVKQQINGLDRGLYIIKFTTESGRFAAKKLVVE